MQWHFVENRTLVPNNHKLQKMDHNSRFAIPIIFSLYITNWNIKVLQNLGWLMLQIYAKHGSSFMKH